MRFTHHIDRARRIIQRADTLTAQAVEAQARLRDARDQKLLAERDLQDAERRVQFSPRRNEGGEPVERIPPDVQARADRARLAYDDARRQSEELTEQADTARRLAKAVAEKLGLTGAEAPRVHPEMPRGTVTRIG